MIQIQISKTISCEYLQDYNQYLRVKTIELYLDMKQGNL